MRLEAEEAALPRRAKKLKVITKATRRPRRGPWPPDPARVRSILDGLEELYPEVDCELDRENPFQLLVATILSAQCTDERVNLVTPELFRRYPTPEELARSSQAHVETIIKSTGFFRSKATNIRGMAAALVDQHHGQMPRTMEELT